MLDVSSTEENPFAPSEVGYASLTASDMPRQDFVDLDTKELRRLCTAAGVTRIFAWLWCLFLPGLFDSIGMLIFMLSRDDGVPDGQRWLYVFGLLLAGAVLFVVVAAIIGVFTRSSFGRLFGILSSILTIIYIVLAPVGVVALYYFIKSKPLFGPGRLPVSRLQAEYRYRRKHKIA